MSSSVYVGEGVVSVPESGGIIHVAGSRKYT